MSLTTAAFVERLDAAVGHDSVEKITDEVRELLSGVFRAGKLRLDDRFFRPRDDCYARRLLHRDERLGYTAVVMTWGPGQCTPLHDHAGIWCVEGVAHGEMRVSRFDLIERRDGLCRFREIGSTGARVGTSGALIPPQEHHILGNALDDRVSITLHVYGGEMDRCSIFEPQGGGWYRPVEKRLVYVD